MKTIVLACLALSLAPLAGLAVAETPRPAALSVRTSDIDLDTPAGVERLSERLVRRMWAVCGHPTQAGLTYANTGGGLKEREACKAGLRVEPDAHAGVKEAFRIALTKFK